MQTTVRRRGVSLAGLLTMMGCGGGTETPAPLPNTMWGGTSGSPASGAGSVATSGSGAKPSTGGSGSGASVGGAGSIASSGGAGASSGGAGSVAAGSGGSAGSSGTAGLAAGGGGSSGSISAGGAGGSTVTPAGDCGPAAFACRGPAPTMDSALGNAKGPYAVESYTNGYRNGPEFADATIFYPTGEAAPPFGCVSVVPGFASPQSSTRPWGPFLASHGIVTITIGTNSTSDPPAARAEALMDALETCTAENERADSPIKGKISKDHLGVA
ncbi:MAG: hypothetical protein RL701_1205, partial [Pseudomonadota bacterium]